MNESNTGVEVITNTNSESIVDNTTIDGAGGTQTAILTSEADLLKPEGHIIPESTLTVLPVTSTAEAEVAKPKTADEIFIDLVSPHLNENLTFADVLAAYPNTTYGQMMAAEEWGYRTQKRYEKLVIKLGSFQQDVTGGHPTFKNKIHAELLCPSSRGGSLIWVSRATSDFWTFKGCPSHKKVVSKIERAERAKAALQG